MPKWGKPQPKPRRAKRGRPRREAPKKTRLSPYAQPFLYMLLGAIVWAWGPSLWDTLIQPAFERISQRVPEVRVGKTKPEKKAVSVKKAKPVKEVALVKEEKKPEVTFHFYQMLTRNKANSSVAVEESRGVFSGYVLQVGAFRSNASCAKQKRELKKATWPVLAEHYQSEGVPWCRVLVGPFSTLSEAYQAKNKLYQIGYHGLLKSYSK